MQNENAKGTLITQMLVCQGSNNTYHLTIKHLVRSETITFEYNYLWFIITYHLQNYRGSRLYSIIFIYDNHFKEIQFTNVNLISTLTQRRKET